MPSLALLAAHRHTHAVPRERTDPREKKLLGRALAVLRARAGLTQSQAGAKVGMTAEGWRKYEAGMAAGIFSPDTQDRLTSAIGSSPEQLLEERAKLINGTSSAPTDIPGDTQADPFANLAYFPTAGMTIRDAVQAGAWLAADDVGQDEPRRWPAARDPRYPNADQWLSEVRGDSMTAAGIFDGDLIHCVSVMSGYYPKSGDIVEVERLRAQGALRELTVKQVEVLPDKVLLWPRSTNPRWRDALVMTEGLDDGAEIEVRVRALVVASIRRHA
jgi:SOS-response transcriptional repressor LexA